jgi:hypothetical protein
LFEQPREAYVSSYRIALFAHYLGILLLFIAVGLSHTAVARMKRASSVEQLREWTKLATDTSRVFPVSNVLILVSGGYMTYESFSWWPAWLTLSLTTVLLLAPFGGLVVGKRITAIREAAESAGGGAVTPALSAMTGDKFLTGASNVMAALGLAVMALMTFKLDWGPSSAILGTAVVLGLASSQRSAAPLPVAGRPAE